MNQGEGNVFAKNQQTGLYGPICDDSWDIKDVIKICFCDYLIQQN
jgi:hypothetical protein